MRRSDVTLLDYLFRFSAALANQLIADEKRYKDEWRKLPSEGQEDRVYQRFEQYWVEFSRDGLPIPWLEVRRPLSLAATKSESGELPIAGLAMIAWVRDNYPEALVKP